MTELLEDPRERLGHAAGTLYIDGISTSVCAIFDMKEWQECSHWDEDDCGVQYLRDFTKILTIPTPGTTNVIYTPMEPQSPTPTEDAEVTDVNANVFFGYLNYHDDPPRLVMATIGRNNRGKLVGEVIVHMTPDMLLRLREDLPAGIVVQIRQFREDKARREEVEVRNCELEEWEAKLQKREQALQEREGIIASVE